MMALAMTAPASTELDRATLDRARALDPLALRAFVVRYERPVFALLSRMLGPGPHVEDLAQETFLRALRALPAFRPDGAARASTWLLTIATRLALDARKKKQLPLAPPEAADAVPDRATPETERARRELGRRLALAAEALSDDQRAAFLLSERPRLHDGRGRRGARHPREHGEDARLPGEAAHARGAGDGERG